MPAPSPLVSVVVLTRDDERHVTAALESVTAQDYPAIEVVIADGSRDRTGAVVRAFVADPRTQSRFSRVVVIDGQDGGGPEAVNRGVRESRGVYVALLNGDERLLPRRLTRMTEVCRSSGAEIAFSRVEPLPDGPPAPSEIEYVYNVQDNMEAPAKDGEWFTMQIVVNGKRITTAVNGKTISDYTEPEGVQRPADMAGRVLSSGTFALQGHDPKSKVFVKNIMVKPLP